MIQDTIQQLLANEDLDRDAARFLPGHPNLRTVQQRAWEQASPYTQPQSQP